MPEFESPGSLVFAEAMIRLPNPLDARITAGDPTITLKQPEGTLATGLPRMPRYDIVIPPKIFQKVKDESAKPADQIRKVRVNVSLFWGAGGNNISIYGLKYWFKDSEDTILVCVEGFETNGPSGGEPKNVGFHKSYFTTIIAALNTAYPNVNFNLLEPRITILAAYSTGYGGLGQSVNNDFFELESIERIVLFDCLYRADKPKLPTGERPPTLLPEENNSGPDEFDPGHANSAFNTRRAIIKIEKAQQQNIDNVKNEAVKIDAEKAEAEKLPDGPDKDKKLKEIKERYDKKNNEALILDKKKLTIIAYTVTEKGSPKYLNLPRGKYPYTVFVPVLIDLRIPALEEALWVLSLTRALDAAKRSGIITEGSIPASYRQFIPSLPARGDIRSGDVAKRGSLKTLKEWRDVNIRNNFWSQAASADRVTAVTIISDKKVFYGNGYPDPITNAAGMLHIGHLVDFGGEFLL